MHGKCSESLGTGGGIVIEIAIMENRREVHSKCSPNGHYRYSNGSTD